MRTDATDGVIDEEKEKNVTFALVNQTELDKAEQTIKECLGALGVVVLDMSAYSQFVSQHKDSFECSTSDEIAMLAEIKSKITSWASNAVTMNTDTRYAVRTAPALDEPSFDDVDLDLKLRKRFKKSVAESVQCVFCLQLVWHRSGHSRNDTFIC